MTYVTESGREIWSLYRSDLLIAWLVGYFLFCNFVFYVIVLKLFSTSDFSVILEWQFAIKMNLMGYWGEINFFIIFVKIGAFGIFQKDLYQIILKMWFKKDF